MPSSVSSLFLNNFKLLLSSGIKFTWFPLSKAKPSSEVLLGLHKILMVLKAPFLLWNLCLLLFQTKEKYLISFFLQTYKKLISYIWHFMGKEEDKILTCLIHHLAMQTQETFSNIHSISSKRKGKDIGNAE